MMNGLENWLLVYTTVLYCDSNNAILYHPTILESCLEDKTANSQYLAGRAKQEDDFR